MSLEQCPFCKSDLNEGANTCASCGAYEYVGPTEDSGCLRLLLFFFTCIFGLGGFASFADDPGIGLLMLLLAAGCVGGLWFFASGRRWLRRS